MIIKLGGSNNPSFPLYTETVHQDNARAAGLEVGHYWANGKVGTPAEIARAIVATGQVKPGEEFWWDIEDWVEDGVTRWSPAEVAARTEALEKAGVPVEGPYLNQSLANGGGYTGKRVWLAAYTDAEYVLIRGGWKRDQVAYWQFTSSGTVDTRGVYNANLDVNRSGEKVWDVQRLQEALNAAMPELPPLVVDNSYGDKTRQRVIAFQKKTGLAPDGDAGSKTISALVTAGA